MTVRQLIAALEALSMPDAYVLVDVDTCGQKFSIEPTYVSSDNEFVVEIGTRS